MQWSFVDFERSCFPLPDSKTGAKVVRLGAPTIDLLSGLPRFANPFVFPAARGANTWSDRKNRIGAGHFVGIEGIWQRVRGRQDGRPCDCTISPVSLSWEAPRCT